MDFSKLEKNICDVIYEAQLKIGYGSHSMSMNYPLDSLDRMLGVNAGAEEMKKLLSDFADYAEERLGRIGFSMQHANSEHNADLVRIDIPAQGVEYIHEHADKCGFLPELVELMKKNTTKFDDITALFGKYSDKVHVEKSSGDEFDYLVYFEDGKPDGYYYCFADEGVRMTYHRFTREDYEAFGF